jgi:hypothetical protein
MLAGAVAREERNMSRPGGSIPNHEAGQEDEKDAQRWQEAKQLRQEHCGWIVIWLAGQAEFRAYRRMHGARRDTALNAATASDMKTQIAQVEQAQHAPRKATHE